MNELSWIVIWPKISLQVSWIVITRLVSRGSIEKSWEWDPVLSLRNLITGLFPITESRSRSLSLITGLLPSIHRSVSVTESHYRSLSSFQCPSPRTIRVSSFRERAVLHWIRGLRWIVCLILIDHFPQKSPKIGGSFVGRNLPLEAYCASSSLCSALL